MPDVREIPSSSQTAFAESTTTLVDGPVRPRGSGTAILPSSTGRSRIGAVAPDRDSSHEGKP